MNKIDWWVVLGILLMIGSAVIMIEVVKWLRILFLGG